MGESSNKMDLGPTKIVLKNLNRHNLFICRMTEMDTNVASSMDSETEQRPLQGQEGPSTTRTFYNFNRLTFSGASNNF